MSVMISLELPDEMVNRAKEVAQRTGLHFETVLTGWLERGAVDEDVSPLIPGAEYAIYTPYGNEEAARILTQFLNAAGVDSNPKDKE
ncbi:MAG: hypothetical protein H7175_07025 [Burkholderiales bacterium]|nr:hypothetical protein [Anaerolineae bacterium]